MKSIASILVLATNVDSFLEKHLDYLKLGFLGSQKYAANVVVILSVWIRPSFLNQVID